MNSVTPLPPNTCGVHGSYVGSACPNCSTGGGVRHVPVGSGIPASPDKTPRITITYSTWVIPNQTTSAGIPAGFGGRLAVRQFAETLRRLADG